MLVSALATVGALVGSVAASVVGVVTTAASLVVPLL